MKPTLNEAWNELVEAIGWWEFIEFVMNLIADALQMVTLVIRNIK